MLAFKVSTGKDLNDGAGAHVLGLKKMVQAHHLVLHVDRSTLVCLICLCGQSSRLDYITQQRVKRR